MKKCKYCHEEINSQAKICPNCRKKQGTPLWLIILIVLVAIGIISSMGDDNTSPDNEMMETTKTESLTLEDGYTGGLDEYGLYYIKGYVKNNTDKEYDYVAIEFTTYDAEGNTLGSCYTNNSGLEANGRWKFEALCLEEEENIASFKLKEITKY